MENPKYINNHAILITGVGRDNYQQYRLQNLNSFKTRWPT